jgi:hypothetical protein
MNESPREKGRRGERRMEIGFVGSVLIFQEIFRNMARLREFWWNIWMKSLTLVMIRKDPQIG